MKLRPDEIANILKTEIERYEVEADVEEVGTVIQIGDGIARIYGLDRCVALEKLELDHGVTGLALNLEEDNVAAVLFGEWDKIKEGDTVRRTGDVMSIPVGDALIGRVVDPLGNALDGGPAIETTETPADGVQGARRRRPPAGEGAAADRHQGHRLDDPDRARPARADHRRPHHRQDRHLRRHDHQPEGPGRDLHLRRHRAEGVDRARGRGDAAPGGRDGLHDHRRGVGHRGGADQVHGPVCGLRDGRALPLQRPPRAGHVRRPLQARGRLPADVAPGAPPSGPRGLPGRRLLPALAAARAGGEAVRRARRRLADRAAGDRDAGRRRVGLHPDQRHLDHGRPDLPQVGPVLLGRPAGDRRRHLGVPRRRRRPDPGDEQGRRPPAPRPGLVPRARGVLAVRVGARRGHPAAARPRPAVGGDAEPAAVRAVAGRGAGGRDLGGDQRLPRRDPGGRRAALPRGAARLPAGRGHYPEDDRRDRRPVRRDPGGAEEGEEFKESFYVEEEHGRRRRPSAWRPSRTSGGGSGSSGTSRRSPRRWSWSPPRGCAARRPGSRPCARTPTACSR